MGRIDGTSTSSVPDAIRAYLQELEFNGELTLANLEHALAAVPGCANREVYIRNAGCALADRGSIGQLGGDHCQLCG